EPIRVTLSAGVAAFPETSQGLRDAISQTTSALHDAKGQGRDTVVAAQPNTIGLCRLGAEVESALSERRICAAYQPIVNLQTGQMVAEEGLARVILPHGQVLGADQFMGAATDLRLASRIDEVLIDQALDRCRVQSPRGDRRLRFINVSAALLQEQELLRRVASAFSGCDVLGELTGSRNPLVVEITERELLHDPEAALQALQPLLDIGVRLAIDDFGSGYSSFLYLTTLPVSFLKIEMALLKAARTSARARSILKGIQAIAKDLNILTIAEGIEDEDLAGVARDHGMDWAQGYYFGRPQLEMAPSPAPLAQRGSLRPTI
uniref:GGDEF domain-containing phosphodiesterase n=1 Tax=Acidiferrobacter sp. TaxID=1872107 RepID=UPI0026362F85